MIASKVVWSLHVLCPALLILVGFEHSFERDETGSVLSANGCFGISKGRQTEDVTQANLFISSFSMHDHSEFKLDLPTSEILQPCSWCDDCVIELCSTEALIWIPRTHAITLAPCSSTWKERMCSVSAL